MFKNRKIRMIGIAVLLVAAAVLIVLSAVGSPATTPVNLSWPPRPDYSFLAKGNKISLTGNETGLAQYHLSERGFADWQADMEIYFQSEHVEAYPANINEVGLAQYHRSEWESGAAIQNGLEIYHQSEWHSI